MTIDNKLVKVICAILFCVFTFSYLFFYQADILRVTQHIASGGQTFYVPWLGGVLITIFLQLLQVGLNSILGISDKKRPKMGLFCSYMTKRDLKPLISLYLQGE